ncbi:MAG: protoporphyrinogen oxidase [Deltaproteobacteria bacterium]|nr:protoporphyrinogen oxidase [Deltaproteobacteria bacterium]MBW1718243.1 protoporphyrinogen oxidase [Deltaproteobacteria bacterium]MBW1931985.1 protoporphyrinogen oxidase [Deltaproteobacteria bacterium]MBW1937736.1 protoporphyrinogen oxidase [Deltaproteobacteria bacterium]MBW1963939.1 protoporphyrinogen oxidase [Deltaproteobacteria bacterium]
MAKVIIAGGGLSGLSLAWFLKQLKPGWEILVLESEARAGGKAWTIKEDGFVCEKGVNGVLDNKPSTLALAARLGLGPLKSNDAARSRFVIKNGQLIQLPVSPSQFLSSKILSLPGRLRVLAEVIVSKGDISKDESLADFARRRLGREAFEYLIDPMATGIYAGDPERLSLRSCFPRIHELERDYGSLIRAMIKLQKEAKKKGKKGPGAGPGGVLTSFTTGMNELVDALVRALGPAVRLNSSVASISKNNTGWRVYLQNGEELESSHVVLACPVKAVSEVLKETAPDIVKLAVQINYPPVSIVCMGIKQGITENPMNGFGFLAPGGEKRSILGSLWDSSIFPNRAPEGYQLTRTLIGGVRAPDLARLPDFSLLDLVVKEFSELIGLKGGPEFVKIFRWDEAIPQYEKGHHAIASEIDSTLRSYPGLYIRCNWLGGISLNDCVANSEKLANQLAS